VEAGALSVAVNGEAKTSEAGGQATLTVRLNRRPTQNVSVAVSVSNPAEAAIVGPTSLSFTPDDWASPKTVLVNGVDDQVADGPVDYHVDFVAGAGSAPGFVGATAQLTLTNLDDDSAGFEVSAIDGQVGENGDQATFTVRLTSQPTHDVVLGVKSDDESEGSLTISALTFTVDDWNAPHAVAVTGVDDTEADGLIRFQVSFTSITSEDSAYAALALPAAVTVENVDDDTAGFDVSDVSGDTSEGGATATFTVALTSTPSSDVILSFDSSDRGEGTLDVTTLTFTPDNWESPQTVTIRGQDDPRVDGRHPYTITFGATVSDDPEYAAITPADVTVYNLDDDSAQVFVGPISGHTTEAGGTATFPIVLGSKPSHDVTVTFSFDDATEGRLDKTSVTFTPEVWDRAQTVTVTGLDDHVADGEQTSHVVFAPLTTEDPDYAVIAIANLTVVNDDDDSAGITVGALSGNTSEEGTTATFTLVLKSEPSHPVTIKFASNDEDEGTTDVTSVTFQPAQWSEPKTITITGHDDGIVDGNAPYALVFAKTESDDPLYAAITPTNISLLNLEYLIFSYTGAMQSLLVPAGATLATVEVDGAQGGANWENNVNYGGHVVATIPATPGETLYMFVGEQPSSLAGGWNGGGAGENGGGRGGGGASDIRRGGTTLDDRVVVAGGGGGAGYWSGLHIVGGLGGGTNGTDGYRDDGFQQPGGQGGTQTGSGTGTCITFDNSSVSGAFGVGGAPSGCGCEGYGGGGGWYGGAGSGNCRGGGGGSGYVLPEATNVTSTPGGAPPGHGRVHISF